MISIFGYYLSVMNCAVEQLEGDYTEKIESEQSQFWFLFFNFNIISEHVGMIIEDDQAKADKEVSQAIELVSFVFSS